MIAAPDEIRHIWKLDEPLDDTLNDETPSMAWLNMAHFRSDHQPAAGLVRGLA
jgi:hypothetical protein